jgi:uroporphyrinogen decarboxylase
MTMAEQFSSIQVKPNWEGLLACLQRKGTPERTYFFELMIDAEIQDALCERFHLLDGLDMDDPYFNEKKTVRLQRFLGYDFVRQGVERLTMPFKREEIQDTAEFEREGGRSFVNETRGPITSWEEFESYPWPDPEQAATRSLEWYEKNLPDDMCVIGSGGFGHFAEHLNWLFGYETLCYALFDNRELVRAIADKLMEINIVLSRRMLEFSRVKITMSADDMGHKTGPMISPDDLREFVLPGHKKMAEMAHEAGRPYILHTCGNLETIMPDLIDDVRIDAKHSFEDIIETIVDAKAKYGDRIAVLGGVDMDLLSRGSEEEVRARVREVLPACHPGGGFALGSGNSIANYMPVNNYLAMLDEGRKFQPEK